MRHEILYKPVRIQSKTDTGVTLRYRFALDKRPLHTCHVFSIHGLSRSLVLDMQRHFFSLSESVFKTLSHFISPVFIARSDCQSFFLEIFDRKHLLVTLNGRSPP